MFVTLCFHILTNFDVKSFRSINWDARWLIIGVYVAEECLARARGETWWMSYPGNFSLFLKRKRHAVGHTEVRKKDFKKKKVPSGSFQRRENKQKTNCHSGSFLGLKKMPFEGGRRGSPKSLLRPPRGAQKKNPEEEQKKTKKTQEEQANTTE